MNDNDSIDSDAQTLVKTDIIDSIDDDGPNPPGFVQPTGIIQNLDQDLDGFDMQEDDESMEQSDEEYFSTQEDMDDS